MAILVVGLISAVLIYVFAADDSEADAAARIASERMYQHNLEVMGGRFAVYADDFDRWFTSLWHGKTLALTVAVLALAAALVCFGIARMVSNPSPGNRPQDRNA
jgi:predicted SnoaL-like aldol condensation-catalyzing enzyme